MCNQEVSVGQDVKPCMCCGSLTAWIRAVSLPSLLFGEKSNIYKCPVCGVGKTIPAPQTSIEYYIENQNYDSLFMENEELYKSFASSLLELIKEGAYRGKRLLDIGCGGGFLVSAAIENGFKAEGIDANSNIIEWAQNRGVPVVQGDIASKILNHEKYDVVVLSAVLEHLPEPNELLLDCKKLLKPGGVVLVSQASFDGLLPSVFQWGWYGWQPQEHFWHFTPSSFSKLAEHCEFDLLECRRNSLYHRYYTSGGLKTMVGRNVATMIARIGVRVGRGDSFDCILSPR